MATEVPVPGRRPMVRTSPSAAPKRRRAREPFARHQRTIESVVAEMRRLEHVLRRQRAA